MTANVPMIENGSARLNHGGREVPQEQEDDRDD